jgi:hypothetical protein
LSGKWSILVKWLQTAGRYPVVAAGEMDFTVSVLANREDIDGRKFQYIPGYIEILEAI